jgi:hypothetical protein
MNCKGCGRKGSCPNLMCYPGICLDRLSKTTKILSQDSRSPGRDFNPGPPEYKVGALTTRSRLSVLACKVVQKLLLASSYHMVGHRREDMSCIL